jgi:ATP-dependent exoDNAse (exonuclease V) alpha subunit
MNKTEDSTFNEQQQKAFDIAIDTDEDVFLTGEGGTGKTYLANHIIAYLRSKGKEVAVLATTGIASSHISGKTIHSFFGLGIRADMNTIVKQTRFDDIAKTDVYLIDEVSMMSKELLDVVHNIVEQTKRHNQKYRFIYIGDFCQLPPIVKRGENVNANYAFMSSKWKAKILYLTKKVRQNSNDKLVEVLDGIRNDKITPSMLSILDESKDRDIGNNFVNLFTHNVNVDALNMKRLHQMEGEIFTETAIHKGREYTIKKIYKNSLVQEKLHLKIGAYIMFIKNDKSGSYVNGSCGVLHRKNDLWFAILDNGTKVDIEREEFKLEMDDLERVVQYPIKLAWAVTIHKSQGMTISKAEIDLTRTFVSGQSYVALSRLTSISGLRLKYSVKGLKLSSYIIKVDKLLRDKSII